MAEATSRNKYVAEAVRLWKMQKSLKPNDKNAMTPQAFAETLLTFIASDIFNPGVPAPTAAITPGLGVTGKFDQKAWHIQIDPDAFSENVVTTVGELTPKEVREIVGTLYHEARHADQNVLVVRTLLKQNKSVADIARDTKIPTTVVDAIKTATFKTAVDAAQKAHAERMFAVMYGQHNAILHFLVNETASVGELQSLKFAEDAAALTTAAPHVTKLRDWATNTLAPQVKALVAVKKPGPVEAQLKQDLGALSQATTRLVAAFDAASTLKTPTKASLSPLRTQAAKWEQVLIPAYNRLESEKEAAQLEAVVQQEFEKARLAKPKPTPKPAPVKKK